MSLTRNNQYVPQWYQEGFFEPGRTSLADVDMTPDRRVLPYRPRDRSKLRVGRHVLPKSRASRQKDLYSTFFDTSVNDEIERRLFGDVDGRSSKAVRAFIGTDMSEWHERGAKPSSSAGSPKGTQQRREFKKSGALAKEGRISCAFPPGGIQANGASKVPSDRR